NTGAAPTASDDVLFDTTIPASGSVVIVSAGRVAQSMYFANSYTLSGGDLSMSVGRIDVDAGKTATANTVLGATSGFRKVGPGTLVLAASTNFTGTRSFTVADGVLSFDSQT